MMKFFFNLRSNKKFVTSFSIILFVTSLVAISLLIGRIFIDSAPLDRFLVTIFYFTTQSNILVFVSMLLFLLNKEHRIWCKIISFIALVDITITGLVFYLFLSSYMVNVGLMQHLLHLGVPLLYLAFYFILLTSKISLKNFWIALIHPTVFIVSVYTWIHPFFGEMLSRVMTNIEGASYVYPFLDPSNYAQGTTGLLLFNLGLLTPFIILISLGLILLKNKFESRLSIYYL